MNKKSFPLLFYSAHSILAVILSSESINSETAAHNSVENVLQSPDSASKNDAIEEKSSDTPTNIERTNLKSEEIVIISERDAGGISEYEKNTPDKIIPNTKAELPQQAQTIESNENVEIPEQKITTQKSSDDNV